MSICIAVRKTDGSERIVSSNLKSVGFATDRAVHIAECLRKTARADSASASVKVYAGQSIEFSVDLG